MLFVVGRAVRLDALDFVLEVGEVVLELHGLHVQVGEHLLGAVLDSTVALERVVDVSLLPAVGFSFHFLLNYE